MTIEEFAAEYGLVLDYADYTSGVENLLAEMDAGLAGGGSLAMLPTYLTLDSPREEGTRVIALDAGGTNLRVTLVSFDATKKPTIEYREVFPMPGSRGPITVEECFDTIATYLAPVADKSDHIGFCFSYPCEILPNLDAKVLQLTKEVYIEGIEGKLVGECLKQALAQKNLPHNHNVVVLNDTVATLLGAVASSDGRPFGSYIGFILGTGTNCCYVEQGKNIAKLGKAGASMIINMESGNYSGATRTAVDIAFDAATLQPGAYQFEKMISGAYQGGLLLAYIREAAKRDCFSPAFGARLAQISDLQPFEVDTFMAQPFRENKLASICDEADRLPLYTLVDIFYGRVAALTTICLTAVLRKTGAAENPLCPVCISAEGSTFYKSAHLNRLIRFQMDQFAHRQNGLQFEFMHAQDSTILGTAVAAQLAGK